MDEVQGGMQLCKIQIESRKMNKIRGDPLIALVKVGSQTCWEEENINL